MSKTTVQTQFKIETDKPIPTILGRGRQAIYPWAQLTPGASFLIPLQNGSGSPKEIRKGLTAIVRRVYPTAYAYGKRHGGRFACRSVPVPTPTEPRLGVRFYRIA